MTDINTPRQHAEAHTNYVVSGFTLDVNFGEKTLEVSGGEARILVTSVTERSDGEIQAWTEETRVVRAKSESFDLEDGENYVWVAVGGENGLIVTDGEEPHGHTLLVGIVDPVEPKCEHTNREPGGEKKVIESCEPGIVDGGGEVVVSDGGDFTTQTVDAHAGQHEDGGFDELNLGDQAGEADPVDHALEHEQGGTDELDLGSMSGEATPEPHNNDEHSEDFLSPQTADSAMTDTSTTFRSVIIPAVDLSSLTLTQADDEGLFYHNGASDIQLTDGSFTNESGYYRWFNAANAWEREINRASFLNGYKADDFLKNTGDTSTGPIQIKTKNERAIMSLIPHTNSPSADIHMGGTEDDGMRIRYDRSEDVLWFGTWNNISGFSKSVGIDMVNDEVIDTTGTIAP